jgi:hypothetical protein
MRKKNRLILLLLCTLLFTHQPEKKKTRLANDDKHLMKFDFWHERQRMLHRANENI